MKVLVTGGTGFVGGHVIRYLNERGIETLAVDLTERADVRCDLSLPDKVFNELAPLKFDAVVHLAAIADLRKTQEDPYSCFRINDVGTLNMLELSLRKNVERFVYASSANVYGAPSKLPVTESDPISPRVPYDYSKVVGESLAMAYYAAKKLPVTVTRSWLLFGENDLPNRAVPRFIRSALKGERITLYNGGKDTTAPTHAANYGKLVYTMLKDDRCIGQAFNFGGERAVSIRELAQVVKSLTGSTSELQELPPRSEAESEPQISYPSLDKVRGRLGYTHEFTLEQGLMRTIEWIRSLEHA